MGLIIIRLIEVEIWVRKMGEVSISSKSKYHYKLRNIYYTVGYICLNDIERLVYINAYQSFEGLQIEVLVCLCIFKHTYFMEPIVPHPSWKTEYRFPANMFLIH